jgi:hypothetical protein
VRGEWCVARTAFSRKASSLELSGRAGAGAASAPAAAVDRRRRIARQAGTARGMVFVIAETVAGWIIAMDRRFFSF